MVTQPRPISGYAGVVDHLRREISLGRILPGERLPPERTLAAQLGVARETLRQALRVLEGSGHITVTRGTAGGAVVQESSANPDLVILELRARRDDLFSLLEYRGELETSAARLAAERRTDSDLAAMDEAQQQLAASGNKDEARRADTAFHLAIAAATGNGHLAHAVEDARAAMFDPVDLATFDFMMESSHTQHEVILDAIRAGDGTAAEIAMRDHIENTRDEMQALIEGS